MVSGPYRGGAKTEAERAANLEIMNRAAYAVLQLGHVPVIAAMGPERFDEIMKPVSLALVDRCDACLRIGGPSTGADEEAARFAAQGKPVWRRIEDVPQGADHV